MNTEDNEITVETKSPEPSFAPPILVSVHTNNLNRCELRIAGADGVAKAIVIPSDGNVYQGLHRARPGIQAVLNEILAAHGLVAKPDGVDADGNATWQGEPHPPPMEMLKFPTDSTDPPRTSES